MTSREGFDAYCLYLGIKLHFTQESYDYVKYNGVVKADLKSFLRRKDKYHFAKLARKYGTDLKSFLIANLSVSDRWVGELLGNDSEMVFSEYKKRQQSLTYLFQKELSSLSNKYSLDELLQVKNGQHPVLLKQYLAKKVSPETMILFDELTKYIAVWDKQISETIVWKEQSKRLKKHSTFVSGDHSKLKKIAMDIFT
jgi:hypothetical protein